MGCLQEIGVDISNVKMQARNMLDIDYLVNTAGFMGYNETTYETWDVFPRVSRKTPSLFGDYDTGEVAMPVMISPLLL